VCRGVGVLGLGVVYSIYTLTQSISEYRMYVSVVGTVAFLV
jgi:hypothetical protein